MNEKILFLSMFSDYQPPEHLQRVLSQAVISAASIDPDSRLVEVDLELSEYIPEKDMELIQEEIAKTYELKDLWVNPSYPADVLYQVPHQELLAMFVEEDSMALASLSGAQWEWDEDDLHIYLPANGKDALQKVAPKVCEKLHRMFHKTVQMHIHVGNDLSGQELLEAMAKMREQMIQQLPKVNFSTENTVKKPPQTAAFFGNTIRGKVTPMEQVSLDMASVVVEGRVFSVEHKELKKRNAWIINFDMTDNHGSVRVNRFMENKDAKPILEKVKVGTVLKVQGRMNVNKFDNETVLQPTAMMFGSLPKREDTAPSEKRVELHLHTAMSNMDALTNTDAVIKQAAAWGHRAIAITDHGCCQSFTDALHTLEDRGGAPKVAGTNEPIKVLYGCEGYYVNDVDDIVAVMGDQDCDLQDEFVAFDLETTGLDSRKDQIIEIGAVIMKNGVEVDRYQTFVDPKQKLSAITSELTGITDAMLKGAPTIDQVLPEFLKFVGDRVLVAHNADFDTGFVQTACKKLGYDYRYTSVDTLVLSKVLMPALKKFKLNLVADALNLPEFRHHRAADDAAICGMIMVKFAQMLAQQGVTHLRMVPEYVSSVRGPHRRESGKNEHIVVLAKNQMGLRNLYHLLTDANLKYFKKNPRFLKSQLMKLREGLIIGSACENNELFQAVINGKSDLELQRIAAFYDYLEIQPLSNNGFMLRPGKGGKAPIAADEETLRNFNRKILSVGDTLGKMVVATGDVHFLNPEDEIFRHVLLGFKGYDDADKPNPLYFRTTDEMLREFAYLGEDRAYELVVTNPNRIADMCDTVRPVPHNLFAPKIENSVEDLKALVYGKMHKLYGENPPELIVKRVETELNDIITCNYDVIYMSAQRLVQNSLENGYLVGSRGSVGSSIVAYMSGITEVNSFPPHYRCPNENCKYTTFDTPAGYECGADLPDAVCPKCGTPFAKEGFNIPFETFLGFGGDKIPDIDLNFSGEYQARAHAYCTEMFGKSHVFRAGTIGGVAEKTAYGYVKKYLEERSLKKSPSEMNRLAAGCVGVRRTTGQHPGGLVVIPQENEIWDFCPVQHPADDPTSDQITTHFEYHSMEENLLKLDMLGHDDPTMIRMMEDMTGVDAKTIPLDDKKTMSIFTSSKVLGYEKDPILGPTGAVAVPEFNTRFTRGVLLDTKPEKFDFLVRISGYTHGTDVWLGNAKDLIVSGTAQVDQTIGCRDDIMIYLISCGLPEKRAFKIMESVRKGRGLPDGAEQEMKEAGVPEWYIGSCKKIKYLFPKAHAVAYVMMAFRIAWFKVYHPLAFYAAYFYRRSQKGGFDVTMMTGGIEKAIANIKAIETNDDATNKDEDLLTTLEVAYEYYLRGFSFLPIDLYKSHATKFLIEDGKLRPPFISISGLGESAAWDLMEGREGKQFISIEEVSAACPKVSKTHIQMLKEAGAFGDLPETSQVSLF